MKITNRYGVKVKGSIVPYGTNKILEAKSRAELWKGEVIDFSAIGRKVEKAGNKVEYTYRGKKK